MDNSSSINTAAVSTLFIGIVALTKVTLNRFIIIPLIDVYGWKLFTNSINNTKAESVKMYAIYCVLMESIARNESIEKRYKIIGNYKNDFISKSIDIVEIYLKLMHKY